MSLSAENQEERVVYFSGYLRGEGRERSLDTTLSLETQELGLPSGKWTAVLRISDALGHADSLALSDTIVIDRKPPVVSDPFPGALVYRVNDTGTMTMSFLTDGTEVFCTAAWRGPDGQTLASGNASREGGKYVSTLRGHDRSRNVGQWSVDIECPDDAGNIGHATGSLLLGVRPPRIVSPEDAISGTVAVRGTIGNVNGNAAQASGDVRWKLHWRHKGESGWRSEGLRVASMYHAFGDSLNMGHGAVVNAQTIALWDASVVSGEEIEAVVLRLAAESCAKDSCMGAVDTVDLYHTGDVDEAVSFRVSGLGASKTINAGDSLRLVGIVSGHRPDDAYELKWSLRDAEGMVLADETVLTPVGNWQGAPSLSGMRARGLRGVALGVENGEWFISANEPIQGLKLPVTSMEKNFSGAGGLFANAMPIMGGDSVLAEKLNVTIGLKSKSIASCDSLKKVTGVTCNILEMTPDSTSADAVRWNMVIGIPAGANIDKVSLGRGISGEMTMMASAMPASSDTNTVKTASMLFDAEKVYAGDSLSHAPHPAYGWPIVLAEAVPFDWDGFSQVGKRYPHGGWARLSVLAVSRNTGAAYLYEDSLYIHAGSPRIVGLKTTPDALYHSSNGAGLDLGQISFSFGLAGSDARYRVFVAQGDKMVKDFGERRYNAAADSSAYRMDWDGLLQDASLATAGTYALAFERLDENGNPIDTLRSAPFEVKMTAWTDYASRKDLPGVTPRFRIRESAMNGEDAYVGATDDYLLAGTLSAKQLKGDSLDCTVDFKGTQTIYDYPAQRYTVGIRQRRDRFQLDVYVAVIGEGWGELEFDWFSFSWENNDGHRQYYVIKKKRLTISRDLDDTITVQGHWEDNGIGYDGYKNSDTRDTRLVVIAVDPDNPGDEKTRKALKEISDNMNSNGVWKFTRTRKQQKNNEHHADVAEFLTDSASGVFSWNKLAGFRDTVAEYSATAPACGSFREDSGYKSCAGDVFNGNKNLFRISARPVAGEKHWTYGNLEKMTSNNNGAHEDVGASFRLKVPREYFDANWGVQNYANSMARMDGFNSDKAGMVPMLVNPLHSVTWPLADEENQLAFDGSDSAKLPDDNLRTEFRFFGGYGDPSLYQSLAVSGDAPCGTVTNANSGSSGNGGFDVLVCRGPVKTMEATVSLKAKKSGLRRVSIPYPATGYSWKHDKANELCDEESAANGELKSCYYRDSLASGIHYYSVGSGERLPEAFSLPIDVKTGFVSDSIARVARASGLDASRIGKAQCALKIPIDRYDAVAGTVGALAAGVNSPANGENGCAVFTTHDNGNGVSIESASLKVAATSTANDWKCNGHSCESFPLTDDGLMLSRAAADSDLVDWDPKADPAFEDNRLAKEFPVSSRKGASRNVFVRRSDLLGANHDAPVNLGHEVFSWKDAYVKGRDTKAPDSSGAVMWLADRTYKARPDLIGLRMDSAIVYDVAGFRHGVFLGSLSGKDSVKVSRADGGAASAPEWVTVLMNGKWEGDELTLMCMQDSGVRVVDGAIWKQADSGAAATVNDTTYNVLGYIDVKRLTGSTSFFLVSHKGEESYYRKLDVHVGSLVRPGTETIVRSVYGDASVKLPAGSYESEVAGTVRLVSPGESRLVAEEGLPVVGPVIEVLPSRRFCTAESCSFENMPQVNVTISRAQFESSQLNGVAEKDPSALRLYKVADESIVPLEHTVLTFMTMDGTACDPVDPPCREWKWLRVSGSTGSFSTFALMDSALAVGHDVDFVVEPEESASPERRIRFDGLGIGGVEFYWDDDTLFTEANDATPPIAALGYDGNLPLDTVLRLPNAAYRQYLHAVPILMDGALSPSRAVWREVRLPGELKFAYVGADTVWFGNVNGRLTVPCSTTSDVALLARFNDRFGETWLEESDTVRAPGSDMDFLAPLLLRQPSYRLVLAATDVLGANLQILGPLVKVDGDLPAASLKASLVYGSKAKVADWTLVSSDSTSGVAKAEWSISLGGREVLSGAVDAPADTLTRADTIPISELERCPGCELRMTARVLDRGGNMTTRSVTWKSVYPFPNSLVAWYPMTEGVGGRLIDHGPSGMDLTFNRADGIWPNGVSLELSHNGLATTAAWTNLAGNDTSWAIEGWYRGMSGMTIRPLWSWGMWNAYRLDDDLIFVSGEATHRFAKVFADNGVAIHLALNYADGRMEVWRDGRLMSAQCLAGPVELAGKAALNLGDGHRTVGASLRDWRFYGHALTASQISELASRRGWAAEDPCIVGIASNVHAYIKDQSAAGSQYANLRLKIVADDGVDLGKNAVIRYYFSEERLAPYAEIWDPWSAPIAGHSDDSGSHWFDFDLRGFARLDGTMGENGRGISVAFRDENDWGRHWNLSDDPSWLESSGDFVPAPRVEVYDTLGNLLSGPSCIEPEENPAAREVHVIAKDASGDMTRGTQLQYYVENVGRTPLVDPVVRYYMTLPEGAPLSVSVWNLANADTQTVDLGGGHRILEIHYKHTLNPGEKSDWNGFASLMLRHNDSWPYIAWDASDDWSHEAMDGRPQANAHITVHDADGRLVWGELPQWGARRFAPDSSEARFENGALEITIDDPGELRVRYVDVLGQDRGLVYLGYLDAGRHVIPLTSRQWSERLLYRTVIELDGKTIWNFSQQE